MASLNNPFISKVIIKNFRNFLNTEVILSRKQVIVGENNVGKTNFLRAIQLILDKDFSDNDRQLEDSDFNDQLEDPRGTGAEIEITIEIQGYEHSRKLKAQFEDAVVSAQPPTLQFTYKYAPVYDENRQIVRYDYKIFKKGDETRPFRAEDRNFINIYVIKALRDVEHELKGNRNSPLYKLVKQYDIAKDDLEAISEKMQESANEVMELDEIKNIKNALQKGFNTLAGLHADNRILLKTFDVDTERLLSALQVYIGIKERPISELSLGFANILFVSLMLLLLKDQTIFPVLKEDEYNKYHDLDTSGVISDSYQRTENNKYILKNRLRAERTRLLYDFMDQYNFKPQSFTILAVEEPEAHLHPLLQRVIYREVLHKSPTSVIFTSHSPYITSVAPLEYMVHIRRDGDASEICSAAQISLVSREKADIERYLDAKRGEIYFGKGIILVEGITEEYIVPTMAQLIGKPLDDYGIVVCNIDSTNFSPYIKLLDALGIPYAAITDGDYYQIETKTDSAGKTKLVRKYHIMGNGEPANYRGNDEIKKIVLELGLIEENIIPDNYQEQDELFASKGFFIGKYTLEVDMMEKSNECCEVFKVAFEKLSNGKELMQENFEEDIDNADYWKALGKIEKYISKGRFAQHISGDLTEDMIPDYIRNSIEYIIGKVTG